jgi:hypothetical protein
MFRDTTEAEHSLGNPDLSVASNHSVSTLLKFIDNNVSNFRSYYFSQEHISDKENAISFHLINYFNSCLDGATEGFIPYSFVKNPPQGNSTKETDVGVIIMNKTKPSNTIIEFEAKRLSLASNNSEYVYGERGGIERFKRSHHGSHLTICGMFGYIQTYNAEHWREKINGWIQNLIDNNVDATINWTDPVLLNKETIIGDAHKYESDNSRIEKPNIRLYHYFINLVP